MVWFQCDDCGDSIKKPKLQNHFGSCSASSFTCIDCSRTFSKATVRDHVSCVTEHEKYALGATKPGGYADKGCFNKDGQPIVAAQPGKPQGLQHLTSRPPWKCTLCGVSCTSQETLLQHAQGSKHVRRAKAAAAAAAGSQQQETAAEASASHGEQQDKALLAVVDGGTDAGHQQKVAVGAEPLQVVIDEEKAGKKKKKQKKLTEAAAVSSEAGQGDAHGQADIASVDQGLAKKGKKTKRSKENSGVNGVDEPAVGIDKADVQQGLKTISKAKTPQKEKKEKKRKANDAGLAVTSVADKQQDKGGALKDKKVKKAKKKQQQSEA